MGTAIVGLFLVAAVSAIIISLVKNKKSGKSSCGGNCSHCAMGGSCHSNKAQTTLLEIEGMMCSMCESHVNDAIRNNFAVKSVKSSHKTGLTQIESEIPLNEEKLRSVIKESGYTLKSIRR